MQLFFLSLSRVRLLGRFGSTFTANHLCQRYWVTEKYILEYQISSNFVGIIFEPVISTLVMFIFLYSFELVKKKPLSEERKKEMSVSKFRIFFGQYVSFLSIFMFPLKFIFFMSDQIWIWWEMKLSFEFFFICSGLVTPFAMILFNEKKHRIMKKENEYVQKEDIEIN